MTSMCAGPMRAHHIVNVDQSETATPPSLLPSVPTHYSPQKHFIRHFSYIKQCSTLSTSEIPNLPYWCQQKENLKKKCIWSNPKQNGNTIFTTNFCNSTKNAATATEAVTFETCHNTNFGTCYPKIQSYFVRFK